MELGAFRTNGPSSLVRVPPHPAYTKPTLRTAMIRKHVTAMGGATAEAGAAKIYALAALPEPPLHFPLGKDAAPAMRPTIAGIAADFDKYEAWSEDLPAE